MSEVIISALVEVTPGHHHLGIWGVLFGWVLIAVKMDPWCQLPRRTCVRGAVSAAGWWGPGCASEMDADGVRGVGIGYLVRVAGCDGGRMSVRIEGLVGQLAVSMATGGYRKVS